MPTGKEKQNRNFCPEQAESIALFVSRSSVAMIVFGLFVFKTTYLILFGVTITLFLFLFLVMITTFSRLPSFGARKRDREATPLLQSNHRHEEVT